MIEREFIKQKIREFQVEEFIRQNLKRVGHSRTKIHRTPLGEKIVIHATRPGLIVGRKGQNINKLTKTLKKRFNFENPQIEISEVENMNLDANIVAERIADSLERFGSTRFKGIGHKVMEDVMGSGALGIEIIISGKIPSSRAKSWRFYQGYLKKCGEAALLGVRKAYADAQLKSGTVGVQVRIMPPDIKLPDGVKILEEKQEVLEEVNDGAKEGAEEAKKDGKNDEKEKHATEAKEPEKKEKKQKKTRSRKKLSAKKDSVKDNGEKTEENPAERKKDED